jgi:hypothetical protein
MTTYKRAAIVLLVIGLIGCEDNRLRPEGPAAPTPPEPAPVRIEYRVNGGIRAVDITYSNASQGTTFVTADLPWFVTFVTQRERTFVFLEASAPLSNPSSAPLVAQIFVNGELFREATARGFTPVVTISGEVIR